MPLLRYFLFVGGSLLALLLVANAAIPTEPLPATLTSASDLPPVRIQSDRKLPERVVFDTSVAPSTQQVPLLIAQAKVQPPVQSQVQIETPAMAAISAKARVREAFAQLPQEDDAQMTMSDMATIVIREPKMYPARQPVKHKVAARPRTARPMMVAQQPRYSSGFYTW